VSPRVEGAGVELAYEVSGSGPDVLFVHGAAGSRQIWAEVVEALGGRVRAIAYDRRGYGESGAPEPYTGTTVEEQTEDAAALVEAVADGPVIVCAHSLGGAIATDLLLRHRELVSAAVLLEPALLSLSPLGPESAGEMREAVAEAGREDGPVAAVDAFLRHYGSERIFDLLGEQRLAIARAAPVPFAADLMAAPHWSFRQADLRSIDVPVTVIRGSRSERAWREAAERMADLMPAGALREAEAGHFIQLENPAAVAAAMADLAAGTESQRGS
jgi:pimeloyl-ACP methyl ester carboxylesterase